jgi:hypothetical protein
VIEIHKNLFVGSEQDERSIRSEVGWFVVHACKEPYHRRALGYSGRAASKDHPEYLVARRPGRIVLNLVDVADVRYVAVEIVDAALEEIHANIATSRVLVHCNQGLSRSPSIAFLYLVKFTDGLSRRDLQSDLTQFIGLYPPYAPAQGMADFVRVNWTTYAART